MLTRTLSLTALLADAEPRAANAVPRRFVLWELHSDDTVRVVELLTPSPVDAGRGKVCGQTLR